MTLLMLNVQTTHGTQPYSTPCYPMLYRFSSKKCHRPGTKIKVQTGSQRLCL